MEEVATQPKKRSILSLPACGAGMGSASGVLFAVIDFLAGGGRLTAIEALQLLLICVIGGAMVGMVSCPLVVFLGHRFFRGLSDTILLCVVFAVGVHVALLIQLSGMLRLAITPIPWILAFVLFQVSTRKRMQHVWALLFLSSIGSGVVLTALYASFPGGAKRWLLAIIVAAVAGGVTWWIAQKRVFITIGLLASIIAAEYVIVGSAPSWDRIAKKPEVVRKGVQSLPNVVLVVLDTTRRDHLGCYGDDRGLTPHLDSFAEEGVVYSQMISPASWTLPSHASMFTGYHPVTHGCGNEHHRWLDGGFDTLAEMLASVGYQTVSITNNHYLAPSNLLQGFQDRINPWLRREPLRTSRWMMAAGFPTGWADHGCVDSVRAVSDWVENDRDSSRPFFLFVNLMEAHWPHFPPMSHRSRWLPEGVGYIGATVTSSKFYGVLWMAGKPHTTSEEQTIRGLYAASIAYQDVQLGGLLDALRQHIDLDRTLVMVTADHGESLGEGGRWDHVFALTDALIHVPMVVRYPARFPAGRRLEGGCQLVDIVPTVFDILERPCPVEDGSGRSLVPEGFQPRRETYAQTSPYYGHLERMEAITGFKRDVMGYTAHLRAVRTDRYKFIWSSRGDHRLYDLAADPNELTNVIEALPVIASEFESRMVQWWSGQAPYVARQAKDSRAIDDDSLESLRSLGYIGD